MLDLDLKSLIRATTSTVEQAERTLKAAENYLTSQTSGIFRSTNWTKNN